MPDWTRYVRDHLRLPDLEGARQDEIVDEVAAQLEDCFLEARAAGAPEREAKIRAEGEIADWKALASNIQRERGRSDAVRVDRTVEAAETLLRRRGRGWVSIADRLQTLRLSMRRLRRSPGFSIVVLVTLAVGIGANTAIFSVVNGILLKPLPFDEPGRLISVWNSAPAIGEEIMPQSAAVHLTYQSDSELIEAIGLWRESEATVLGAEGPSRVPTNSVSSGVFQALRVDAAAGRRFTPDEDVEGAPLTVMLSHAYWQTRYGGDASALGQTLRIDGTDREIVGVLPADFHLFANSPDLLVPFGLDRSSLFVGQFNFRSLARLKDGVTIEQVTAEFARLLVLAPERFPGGMTAENLQQAGAAPVLRPLRDDVVGDVGGLLWLVFGGVGIILIIACANVANLFLVRAESRERELAVRSALGAGQRQISGQFLAESILLGLAGGVVGAALAGGGLRALVALAPEDLPRLHEISLDPLVLLFTVAISIFSGIFFGLFPMLRYRRVNHVAALKEGGRGAGASRDRHRARNALVVTQIALALVLLIGSGLMIRSFQSLRNVNPGFVDPERALVFGLSIPEVEMPDNEMVALTHERIAQRLEEVPGVTSVGLTTSITMDGRGGWDPLHVEDFPLGEGQLAPARRFKWIGPGYFEAMGNPVVAGRQLTWADVRNRSRVLLISEGLAREYWGDAASAIGKRVAEGGDTPGNWREIIGVVGDVRDDGLSRDPVSIVYWPMALEGFWVQMSDELIVPRRLEYVVRSDRVGSPQFLTDLREAVWSVHSSLPLANPRSLAVDLRASMARTSFTLVLLAIAASMALLIGAVGIYGVISYVVSQRTREIGVRIVLGAEIGSVKRMVLGQGLRLAGLGVGVGLIAGVMLTRLMEGVLYGVSPLDPLTYGLVALVLTTVALVASYLPAHRAARVSPMEAIRAE